MNYLLYGTENYLINLTIDKLITKHKIDKLNVVTYDLDNDGFKDLMDECFTMSLFSDKKAIIVKNLFKNLSKEDEKTLEEYLENPNKEVILVIVGDKLDERKKIVKKALKICNSKQFNETNIKSQVKTMFEDYQISNSDIDLLIDRVGNNLELLNSEINKIKIYKDKDLNITRDDVLNLTHKNIDLDVFKLIDYIVRKDKEKAINLYNELLLNNTEPIAIIVMLANQFRIMYQAKELIKKGYTEKNIASTINIHPYRVKLALQNSRNYSSDVLLDYLEKLSDLDIEIKTGNIDKNLGLELFILNI